MPCLVNNGVYLELFLRVEEIIFDVNRVAFYDTHSPDTKRYRQCTGEQMILSHICGTHYIYILTDIKKNQSCTLNGALMIRIK